MSRNERRTYFDRLCAFRDAYAARGIEDRTSVITIADAIDWAAARFDEAGPLEAEASETNAEGTTDKADRAA